MGLRQKLTGAPVIANWQEAEKVLGQIAVLKRKKDEIEGKAQDKVDAILAEMNAATKDMSVEITQLSKNLGDFVLFHKNEFTGQTRSKELAFGTVGFRKSPGKLITLSKWKWETVLAKIQEMKRKRWLKTKLEVDKNAILNEYRANSVNDEELALYGMACEISDDFWYETRDVESSGAVIMDMKENAA